MKKLGMAIGLCLVMVSSVYAANFPKDVQLTVDAGETINATAAVTLGPWNFHEFGDLTSAEGAFALNIECLSATGTADVQIELLPLSMVQGTPTAVRCYDGATDASVVTNSTLTDYSEEGEWVIAVQMCTSTGFYLRFTGVGSNPADTVCKAVIAIK